MMFDWHSLLPVLIAILLTLHFAYHIISSIGIAWSLIHSYKEHKKQMWKLVMAVIWLALSILLLFVTEESLHNSCH